MQTTSVVASHILQKSTQSRNPIDRYRNKQITRTQDEAMQNILNIRAQLEKDGLQNFAKLAEQYSECTSAREGGDLGQFGKGQMQAAFEKVAFALKVGELSQPVITDSGVHIILRTG